MVINEIDVCQYEHRYELIASQQIVSMTCDSQYIHLSSNRGVYDELYQINHIQIDIHMLPVDIQYS